MKEMFVTTILNVGTTHILTWEFPKFNALKIQLDSLPDFPAFILYLQLSS